MTIGKAYGFFDCRATKEQIEAELPTIRELTKVPSALELKLLEGFEALEGTPKFMEKVREAKEAGLKYVIDAALPNATNKTVADEVSVILNQTYQSPLYNEGEPFNGGIIYEENGDFVFRE